MLANSSGLKGSVENEVVVTEIVVFVGSVKNAHDIRNRYKALSLSVIDY